ncbi:hypothetical protein [Bacillus sp. OTU2372]|uniref:hypothetical protein n=1 Tax=Bacillus sp. OTU2372 TaxID=3043858 RepID=UPI00313B950D
MGAFDPDREGLSVFEVHEIPAVASEELHDGATGETLMSYYALLMQAVVWRQTTPQAPVMSIGELLARRLQLAVGFTPCPRRCRSRQKAKRTID